MRSHTCWFDTTNVQPTGSRFCRSAPVWLPGLPALALPWFALGLATLLPPAPLPLATYYLPALQLPPRWITTGYWRCGSTRPSTPYQHSYMRYHGFLCLPPGRQLHYHTWSAAWPAGQRMHSYDYHPTKNVDYVMTAAVGLRVGSTGYPACHLQLAFSNFRRTSCRFAGWDGLGSTCSYSGCSTVVLRVCWLCIRHTIPVPAFRPCLHQHLHTTTTTALVRYLLPAWLHTIHTPGSALPAHGLLPAAGALLPSLPLRVVGCLSPAFTFHRYTGSLHACLTFGSPSLRLVCSPSVDYLFGFAFCWQLHRLKLRVSCARVLTACLPADWHRTAGAAFLAGLPPAGLFLPCHACNVLSDGVRRLTCCLVHWPAGFAVLHAWRIRTRNHYCCKHERKWRTATATAACVLRWLRLACNAVHLPVPDYCVNLSPFYTTYWRPCHPSCYPFLPTPIPALAPPSPFHFLLGAPGNIGDWDASTATDCD